MNAPDTWAGRGVVRVVPLVAAHRRAWENLYAAYADFYRVPRPQGERLETLWQWLTDPNDPMRGLAAVGTVGKAGKAGGEGGEGGKIGEALGQEGGDQGWEGEGRMLGFAHFCPQRNPLRVGRVMYLHDLYVTPAARGRGVGELLLRAAEQAGRAAGCFRMRWATRADNTVAQKLYDRLAERTDWVVYDMNF